MASGPLLKEWPDCRHVLLDDLSREHSWALALPGVAALAVGGTSTGAIPVAAAWAALKLAAHILDAVQDNDGILAPGFESSGEMTNLAAGLIFVAFHFLDSVATYPGAKERVTVLFSETAFYSSLGQHLILAQQWEELAPAEALTAHWRAVILRSGSLFRMVTAGGAATGTQSSSLVASLGDYGNCLRVILQVIDDCRDIIKNPATGLSAALPTNSRDDCIDAVRRPGAANYEVSLPYGGSPVCAKNSQQEPPWIIATITNARGQAVFAIVALCIIVLFAGTRCVLRPYDGMDLQVGDGQVQIVEVYANGPAARAGIASGDQILAINGRLVDGWANKPLYRFGIEPGEMVTYTLKRGSEIITIAGVAGSYRDNPSLLGTLIAMTILSASSWIIGLLLCLFAQPCDVPARLVGLLWLLGGVSIAAGGLGGGSYFWGAYTMMEVAWCGLSLVFVASHLYFPASTFVEHRHGIIRTVAIVSLVLAVMTTLNDWLLTPLGTPLPGLATVDIHSTIYGFFFLCVLTSLALLLRNRFLSRDPEIKRQTGILLWGTALGFAPFFVLTLLPVLLFGLGSEYVRGVHSALFLVMMPLAYAYVAHQRQLLRLDFAINRAVVVFVLVLLVLFASFLILGVITLGLKLPTEVPLAGGLVAALLSWPAASLQKKVQERVNRVLYGCHYDFYTVTSDSSGRLAQTLDHSRLAGLLVHDLPRKMAIQQAALFLAEGDQIVPQSPGNEAEPLAVDGELCRTLLAGQNPIRAQHLWGLLGPAPGADRKAFEWVQLFVPLVFESQIKGLLLLGNRSSGDVYSDQDLRIIATVAHQGALAYANVQLVDKLRGLHRHLVQVSEAQRKQVARDLHDTVLQKLFFVKQGLFADRQYSPLADYLEETIQALRETIQDQRPPFLDRGLNHALPALVEELQAHANASNSTIAWRCSLTGRLPLSDEATTALYRIAQEAVNNAIKHAQASHITVTLEAIPEDAIRLSVADDGVGMPTCDQAVNVQEHHYGLVGMQERAAMINAGIHFHSVPGEGTTIAVQVKP